MSKFASFDNPKISAGTAGFSFRPISPSAFTFKPNEITENSGFKFTSDKPSVFKFGNHESDVKKEDEAGFNFVFTLPNSDSLAKRPTSEASKIEVSSSDTEKDSVDVTEIMESKLNENTKEEISPLQKAEDSNEKNMDEEDSNEENQKANGEKENAKSDDHCDQEISVKMLLIEFKEMINEFSKERMVYEKRITALEKRIEVLENEKKLESEDERNSSISKIDENTIDVCTNNAKESALTSQPIGMTPFNSSQSTIFGSAPSFGSASAVTPANFVFGATAFPSTLAKTPSKNELFNTNTQINNFSPTFGSSGVPAGIIPCGTKTTTNGINATSLGNTSSLFPITQISNGMFPNKENGRFGTSVKVNNEIVENKELKRPNNLEHQNNQKIEETLGLNHLKKSLEESFQKAMRDIFAEFKNTLENEYNKKNDKENS